MAHGVENDLWKVMMEKHLIKDSTEEIAASIVREKKARSRSDGKLQESAEQ